MTALTRSLVHTRTQRVGDSLIACKPSNEVENGDTFLVNGRLRGTGVAKPPVLPIKPNRSDTSAVPAYNWAAST